MSGDKFRRLYTKEGEKLPDVPWNVYPRPRMRREKWLCLNGEWRITDCDGADGTITVPFCPESLLSGYKGNIRYGEIMRCSRSFFIPGDWGGSRILLHFGAVSRTCLVFVNGVEVCRHDNAYLPFSADITDVVKNGENTVSVSFTNDLSPRYPYGKQKKARGGMWYTPVSGIWQTVWLEPTPEKRIEDVRVKTDMRGADIEAAGVSAGEVECDGKVYPLKDGKVRIEPDDPVLWSPDSPHLYYFTVKSGGDAVVSYFALRALSVGTVGGVPRLCLNGRPYFFHGLLDQGYFSDGLYTPAAPELYENDIKAMKALGFNTLRKHIKIEPQQFYYDCDRLGMLVVQDMVNNGKYRFIRDTILPTLGFRRRNDRRSNRDAAAREEFRRSAIATVDALSFHPCVCCWTIFNEGWGQFCADEIYREIKAKDGSRFVDTTSGWFGQKESDVESLHIYFGKLRLGADRKKPQALSEFGGYVYKDPRHSFNMKKTYGYKIFKTRESYVIALKNVYEKEVVPLAKAGLCASILTQVSDVEDETNGILTFDRRVCKVSPEELYEIAEKLQKAVAIQLYS